MQRFVLLKGLLFSVALLAGLALGEQPVAGQASGSGLDRPHVALGYVANAPHMMAGVGGYVMFPYLGRIGRIGVYLDAKLDIEDPSGDDVFEAGYTARRVVEEISGAEFIRRELSYQAVNVALIRPLTHSLAVYAGGGLVRVTEYHLFQEFSSDLGFAGIFWVEAPHLEEVRGNLMVGAFLRMSSFLSTQVGFETEPRGFTVGASFRLPRR